MPDPTITGQYVCELNLSTCTVYKRVSASPDLSAVHGGKSAVPAVAGKAASPAQAALRAMTRGPAEEPFEFLARLESAWEAALKEATTSWSGGDMRKHFCRHVGKWQRSVRERVDCHDVTGSGRR